MIRVKSESDRFLKFWGISSLKTLMVKFSSHVTLLRNNNVFSLNRNGQFFKKIISDIVLILLEI